MFRGFIFERQPLSYMQNTELPFFVKNVNKARQVFVHILNVEKKIPDLGLRKMCQMLIV